MAEPGGSSDVIVASAEQVKEQAESEQAARPKPEKTEETKPAQPTAAPTPAESDPGDKKQSQSPAAWLTQASPYETSPEAARGKWTAMGNRWMFLVDEVPYTGWLNDTDGKRYYLDSEGMMATGWLEEDGKTYYLDEDGIMQTGEVEIDGIFYTFDAYGVKTGEEDPNADKGETGKTASASEKKAVVKEDTRTASKKNSSISDKAESVKHIALTFDDGPGDFTDELLDCLIENNAHATFFMVGKEIENHPETVRRMVEAGCELGNHTYDHTDLTTLTAQQMQETIGATDQLLLELTGQGASVLRPPYGNVNDLVLSTVGTPMILWSIDTLDWKTLNPKKTVKTIKKEVCDGAVILMHDIHAETVEAARTIIPWLIEEGYELLTVHELAKTFGTDLTTGTTYRSFGKEDK